MNRLVYGSCSSHFGLALSNQAATEKFPPPLLVPTIPGHILAIVETDLDSGSFEVDHPEQFAS